MKRYLTVLLVTLIMLTGILGITNPAIKQPYKLFDNIEGNLSENYFIFSIYQQYGSFTISKNGKYRIYRRFIGIASGFYEISPVYQEPD